MKIAPIALFLTLLISISPVSAVWYVKAIQQFPLSYDKKCTFISGCHNVSHRLKQSIFNAKNPSQLFYEVRKNYLTIEQKLLTELGKTIGLSHDEWNRCLATINTLKDLQPSPNAFHDPAIPQAHLNMIISLLKENNIDPATITIIAKEPESNSMFAAICSGIIYEYSPSEEQFMKNPKLTQTLVVYKHAFNESASNQLAIYAHEVQHLRQMDSVALIVIQEYTQHYLQKGRDYLETKSAFKKLITLYEANAEICASLKNKKVAQALADMRSKSYYPNHLYEDHYHDLLKINSIWACQ